MTAYGYKVRDAASAQEALEIWAGKSDKIDMLLTDIVMRESTTGLELAEQLRGNRPALKIVYMSGYSTELAGNEAGVKLRAKGQFLQKPFTLQACDANLRPGFERSRYQHRQNAPAHH